MIENPSLEPRDDIGFKEIKTPEELLKRYPLEKFRKMERIELQKRIEQKSETFDSVKFAQDQLYSAEGFFFLSEEWKEISETYHELKMEDEAKKASDKSLELIS